MNTAPRGRGKSAKSIAIISAATEILEEIQPATIRAICYRLFVAGLIPSMQKSNTNGVSRLLVECRERGELPWGWIVDQTREAERVSTWENPQEIITAAVSGYYFAHPQASYFGVARIGKDQVEDFAVRRGVSVAQAEKWLRPNLGYEV